MIDYFLQMGLSNACLSLALAIVAMVVGARTKRPELALMLPVCISDPAVSMHVEPARYPLVFLHRSVKMATDLSVGEGIIGLQSETAEIFYRNMEIKEFEKPVPLDTFMATSPADRKDKDNEKDTMFVSLVVIRFEHSLTGSSRGFGRI